ncbi:MAG TPA: WXG100 family type VII secretion target [Micromonosporaceae bacterium]|nr:WXG100 family type VII secretion target [Micromonosporaceae bacterium]
MAEGMRTDTGLMAQTAQKVTGVADDLTSMLNQLMDRLTPLQTHWVGRGGTAMHDVKQRFNDDMAKLNTVLRSIAEAVGTSGQDYILTDDELQGQMNQAGATAGQITQALNMN